MDPFEFLGVVTGLVMLALVTGFGVVALRRFARSSPSAALSDADELRARVAELEVQQARVAELEERLDFAERLLAEQRSTAQLPRS